MISIYSIWLESEWKIHSLHISFLNFVLHAKCPCFHFQFDFELKKKNLTENHASQPNHSWIEKKNRLWSRIYIAHFHSVNFFFHIHDLFDIFNGFPSLDFCSDSTSYRINHLQNHECLLCHDISNIRCVQFRIFFLFFRWQINRHKLQFTARIHRTHCQPHKF